MGTCLSRRGESVAERGVPRLEDPGVAAETNSVLNRFRCIEITLLQARFRDAVQSGRDGRGVVLDQQAFHRLFPFVKSELPHAMHGTCFAAFDFSDRGVVDFRDFCRALSFCCLGTRTERMCFLYDLCTGVHTTTLPPEKRKIIMDDMSLATASRTEATRANPAADTGEETKDATTTNAEEAKHQDEQRQGDHDRDQGSDTAASMSTIELASKRARGKKKVLTEALVAALGELMGVPDLASHLPPADGAMSPSSNGGSGSGHDAQRDGVRLEQFCAALNDAVDDSALEALMCRFDLLPLPEEELKAVGLACQRAAYLKEGSLVNVVASSWWIWWSRYTSASVVYDSTETLVLGVSAAGARANGKSPIKRRKQRPDEIDNSSLQDGDTTIIREGSLPGLTNDFVVITEEAWAELYALYGGGPSFVRALAVAQSGGGLGAALLGSADASAVPPPTSAPLMRRISSSCVDVNKKFTAEVDLYPFLVSVYWANELGRPDPYDPNVMTSFQSTVLGFLRNVLERAGINPATDVVNGEEEERQQQQQQEDGTSSRQDRDGDGPEGREVALAPTSIPEEWVAKSARLWLLWKMSERLPFPDKDAATGDGADGGGNDNGGGAADGGDVEDDEAYMDAVGEEEEDEDEHSAGDYDEGAADNPLTGHEPDSDRPPQGGAGNNIDDDDDDDAGNGPPGSDGRRRMNSSQQGSRRKKKKKRKGDENIVSFRYGVALRWVLVPERLKSSLLSECGVTNNSRVMIEVRADENVAWPTDRLIEPPGFRNFQKGDRVDAMDYEGRWYLGTVIKVSKAEAARYVQHGNSGPAYGTTNRASASQTAPTGTVPSPGSQPVFRQIIRVHFDKYSSKWDEDYESTSHKIAPPGANTSTSASEPQNKEVGAAGGDRQSGGRSGRGLAGGRRAVAPSSSSAGDKNGRGTGGHLQPRPPRVGAGRANMALRVRDIAGATGLANLGNTCFMNSSIQCLSHTPLLRAYLLSDKYNFDINRQNPLGSGGRLVEDFGALLKLVWEGDARVVAPQRFKRTVDKVKPIFSGHDQHDAQEFLAEMLDTMHEDVNRVLDKPYTTQPDDDIWDAMTIEEQARDAWQRHLARNQSALVELFQGQLKAEVVCPVCKRVSRSFDPFNVLSVPIPSQHERTFVVTVFRRMHSSDVLRGQNWSKDVAGKTAVRVGMQPTPGVPKMQTNRRYPVRYAVTVHRLADVAELRAGIATVSGLSPDCLTLVAIYKQTIDRYLGDRDPVAPIRESEMIVAYEFTRDLVRFAERGGSNLTEARIGRGKGGGGARVRVQMPEVAPVPGVPEEVCVRARESLVAHTNSSAAALDAGNGYATEDEEDAAADASVWVDLPEGYDVAEAERNWPPHVGDMPGMRVDALDHRGQWFPGNVEYMDPERGLRVHFDTFSSRWDEFYPQEDVEGGRLQPAYSNTARLPKVFEVQVVHRRNVFIPTSAASMGISGDANKRVFAARKELFGVAFVVHIEGYRSCEAAYQDICQQGIRFMRTDAATPVPGTGGTGSRMSVSRPSTSGGGAGAGGHAGGRASVRRQPSREEEEVVGDTSPPVLSEDGLPFEVRVLAQNNLLAVHKDDHAAYGGGIVDEDGTLLRRTEIRSQLGWEASEFLRDKRRPAVNFLHTRMVVALDWLDATAFDDDTLYPVQDESFKKARERMHGNVNRRGVSLEECLDAFTKEEKLDEDTWYCSKCKEFQPGTMRYQLWRLPDILVVHIKRFNCTARWREKVRTRVQFPLTSLDMSKWVSSEPPSMGNGNAPPPRGSAGVAPPRSTSATDVNVLMENAAASGAATAGATDDLYDLYAVTNHIGGLHGGHYTACCRANPCTKEDMQNVSPASQDASEGTWLYFDDEFVEDMPGDQIVTDAAYVLFYRRRRLTPSNLVNMTA